MRTHVVLRWTARTIAAVLLAFVGFFIIAHIVSPEQVREGYIMSTEEMMMTA